MLNSILRFINDRNRVLQSLLISSCLVLYLCFFIPLDVFFHNAEEFDYLITPTVLYLLLISIPFIALLTLILIAIPKALYQRALSILLAMVILFWIQGNLFNKDFGLLDGSPTNWDKWAVWGYVGACIWAVSIILAIVFSPKITKIVNKTCIVILLTLVSFTVVKYIAYTPAKSINYMFDESTKFNFSSNKNVILIVLDSTQSDVFYEIISKNQSLRDHFNGFVYYPDTVAGSPFTRTSVPNLLTGKYYDCQVPFDEYIEESYLDNSLPKVLKEKGFRVDIIPTFFDLTILKSDEITSNLIKKSSSSNIRQKIKNGFRLIEISIYRSTPQILKKYVKYIWRLSRLLRFKNLTHLKWGSNDMKFYRDSFKIDDPHTEPVFKFFHLQGCHVPYNRNAEGEKVPSETTRQVYSGFVIYNLKRLASFLDELKFKGIYDKSLIYIVGDHGVGSNKELAIRTELIGKNGFNDRDTIPYVIKAKAVPLMMIKNFYSKGVLKISDKPQSLARIPQMIFKDLELNIDDSSEGWSNDGNDIQYTRKYYFYNDWKKMDALHEYNINGHVWFDSSWTGPLRVHTARGLYEKDFSVIFEQNNSGIYIIEPPGALENYGFESVEQGGTDGKSRNKNALTIMRANPNSDYYLSIQVNDKVSLSDFKVYAEDKRLDIVNTMKPLLGVHVPKADFNKEDLEITILLEGDSADITDNPVEAIYLFKRQSE